MTPSSARDRVARRRLQRADSHQENRPVRARIAEATTVIEYLVDGRGRRVGKKVNGVLVKQWLWRGQLQPVAELDGAGNVVARFVYAGGVNVPALMVTSTATYKLIRDHLGSVRAVIHAGTGAVNQEIIYDSWGRVLSDTNPGLQPFGYAGGLVDEATGLVRFGARELDPQTGRWTSRDPIRFHGGVNLFGYVGADPVNARDPRGLCDASAGGCGPTGEGGGEGAPPYWSPPEPPDTEFNPLCFVFPYLCADFDDLDPNGVCEFEPEDRTPPKCQDPCDMEQGKDACETCCEKIGTSDNCINACCK